MSLRFPLRGASSRSLRRAVRSRRAAGAEGRAYRFAVLSAVRAATAWGVAFAASVAASAEPNEVRSATFAPGVRTFLEKHCRACHGEEKQEAQLRFDRLEGYRRTDHRLWAAIHEQIATGAMPPEGRPQPTASERKAVLAWIAEEASAARQAAGAGGTRRLNRRELSAALRDLTGLAVDYADALPGDGTIGGFDTGADGLQDAAASVAQTMAIARRAVDGIRFLAPSPGRVFRADLRSAPDPRKALDDWKNDGASVSVKDVGRPGEGLLLQPNWLGDRNGTKFTLPVPADGRGILRVRLVVSALRPLEGLPDPHLSVEAGGKVFDFAEIVAPFGEPQILVYDVQLEDLAVGSKGVSVTLTNTVELPYAVEGFPNEDRSKPDENIPGGTGLFRPTFDRKLPPEKQPVPFVVLQSVEFDVDHVAQWPPADWNVASGEDPDEEARARRLLGLWIERAWRRPAKETEWQRFFDLYRNLRGQSLSFDDALRGAFQAVLLSGSFRYLGSPADPDPVVAQHALASRLSFLLTGGPPDSVLRSLAAAKRMRDPQVLGEQVDRLLADPRSRGFWKPFVTQWLEMEQPITIAMDHMQKQDFRFGRYLKASMRAETIDYVAEAFARNRPARELVQSDWTMMNDTLARHYGYEGIRGGRLRHVPLRPDDPRGGGILSHAGIQSMLCWMGENWVIYRGAWALRHILDDPPPPPPLEVPELNPSEGGNRGKSFKELLKQHQADSRCSVCHKHMDPLGFAFQNFDLVGRWRDVEHESYERSELDGKIAWKGVGKTRPVDAVGRLPRGEEFASFAQCRQILAEKYVPDLLRGVLKNLVLYGTGREADIDDVAEIREILDEYRVRDYPLRDLLKSFVRSRAFLER